MKDSTKKSDSENENHQELLPVEINSGDPKNETIDNESAKKNLPNSSKFIKMMEESLSLLLKSKICVRIEQDTLDQANINGTPIQILGGDTLKICDSLSELTPERHKTLSSTGYTVKKNEG